MQSVDTLIRDYIERILLRLDAWGIARPPGVELKLWHEDAFAQISQGISLEFFRTNSPQPAASALNPESNSILEALRAHEQAEYANPCMERQLIVTANLGALARHARIDPIAGDSIAVVVGASMGRICTGLYRLGARPELLDCALIHSSSSERLGTRLLPSLEVPMLPCKSILSHLSTSEKKALLVIGDIHDSLRSEVATLQGVAIDDSRIFPAGSVISEEEKTVLIRLSGESLCNLLSIHEEFVVEASRRPSRYGTSTLFLETT
jgi:hypothetical protein